MTDLLKLLDGNVEEVTAGLAGKSHDDLVALRSAEQGGKTRKGVLDALDQAITDASTARAGGRVQSPQANIAPATEVDAAGAPQQIVPDVDLSHPAVDNDPRAGTTVDQNRIDFNDPGLSGQEAVERNLASQSED